MSECPSSLDAPVVDAHIVTANPLSCKGTFSCVAQSTDLVVLWSEILVGAVCKLTPYKKVSKVPTQNVYNYGHFSSLASHWFISSTVVTVLPCSTLNTIYWLQKLGRHCAIKRNLLCAIGSGSFKNLARKHQLIKFIAWVNISCITGTYACTDRTPLWLVSFPVASVHSVLISTIQMTTTAIYHSNLTAQDQDQ